MNIPRLKLLLRAGQESLLASRGCRITEYQPTPFRCIVDAWLAWLAASPPQWMQRQRLHAPVECFGADQHEICIGQTSQACFWCSYSSAKRGPAGPTWQAPCRCQTLAPPPGITTVLPTSAT